MNAIARRVGLFGGTFDPVHNAHVALAQLALTALRLDELRWVPAGQPWQKSGVSPAVHRVAMVALAMQGEPRFVLERCEVDRAGPTYTLDTVRQLQAAEPHTDWFLVIGQDQYAGLHTWKDWRELLGKVTLAVANRPGNVPPVDAEVLRFPHRAVPLEMMDISSTDIRERAAQCLPIDHLVPAAVASYIARHHLYPRPTGHHRS